MFDIAYAILISFSQDFIFPARRHDARQAVSTCRQRLRRIFHSLSSLHAAAGLFHAAHAFTSFTPYRR